MKGSGVGCNDEEVGVALQMTRSVEHVEKWQIAFVRVGHHDRVVLGDPLAEGEEVPLALVGWHDSDRRLLCGRTHLVDGRRGHFTRTVPYPLNNSVLVIGTVERSISQLKREERKTQDRNQQQSTPRHCWIRTKRSALREEKKLVSAKTNLQMASNRFSRAHYKQESRERARSTKSVREIGVRERVG